MTELWIISQSCCYLKGGSLLRDKDAATEKGMCWIFRCNKRGGDSAGVKLCEPPWPTISLCKNHPRPSRLSFLLCLCCVSPHSKHFTSDISDHQMCGVFSPHQGILHNTKWVSYDFTQFSHYLPGDWVRSHRLSAHSGSFPLTPLQMPIAHCRYPGYPRLLSDWPFPRVGLSCLCGTQNSGEHTYGLFEGMVEETAEQKAISIK